MDQEEKQRFGIKRLSPRSIKSYLRGKLTAFTNGLDNSGYGEKGVKHNFKFLGVLTG